MSEFHYDSYCGLYCGACDILHHYKNSLESGKPPEWRNLPATMQKHLPVPKNSPIECYGCKSDSVFHGCKKCPMRNCAMAKEGIENCTECSKYPCLKFRLWKLFIRLGGFYKKLPHLQELNSNLKEIQTIGLKGWTEKQKTFWTCSKCSSELTWYSKEGHRCHK